MVVFRPGEMVQDPEPGRYLRAVAAFEKINGAQAAYPACQVARPLWPDNPLLFFAIGNNALKRKALDEAEILYRQTLDLEDTHIGALNNLADIRAQKGCYEEASQLIERAIKEVGTSTSTVAKLVQSTRREIQQMAMAGNPNSDTTCRQQYKQ